MVPRENFGKLDARRFISGNNHQKRTFDTPRQQSKVKLTHRIVILTPVNLYSRCESHLQPVATRKPGSIETICGTFQTKAAENCDDELTQSAHLRNPCLALHTTVGYTFLYLAFLSRKIATKTIDL